MTRPRTQAQIDAEARYRKTNKNREKQRRYSKTDKGVAVTRKRERELHLSGQAAIDHANWRASESEAVIRRKQKNAEYMQEYAQRPEVRLAKSLDIRVDVAREMVGHGL